MPFQMPKDDPGKASINRRARRIVLVQSRSLILASDAVPAHRDRSCFRAVEGRVDEALSDALGAGSAPKRAGRNEIVHALIAACGLLRYVRVIEPEPASWQDLLAYHDEDFIKALCNYAELSDKELEEYNLTQDACPFPHVVSTPQNFDSLSLTHTRTNLARP